MATGAGAVLVQCQRDIALGLAALRVPLALAVERQAAPTHPGAVDVDASGVAALGVPQAFAAQHRLVALARQAGAGAQANALGGGAGAGLGAHRLGGQSAPERAQRHRLYL